METVLLGTSTASQTADEGASEFDALKPWGEVLTLATDPDVVKLYDRDATSQSTMLPLAVFRPKDIAGMRAAIRWCSEGGVPVSLRCGGTGLSGGAVPPQAGVVFLTGHLRRVVDYDSELGLVTVEPGVTPAQLNQTVAADGWMVPCDMDTASVAGIGGIVASGARPYRQGRGPTLVDLTTDLQVIASDGEPLRLPPAACIGSEGVLGIIESVTLRLLPMAEATGVVKVACPDSDLPHFLDNAAVVSVERYSEGVGDTVIARLQGSASQIQPILDSCEACEPGAWQQLRPSGRKPAFTLCCQLPLANLSRGLEAIHELADAASLEISSMAQLLDGRLIAVVQHPDPPSEPQWLEALLTAWCNILQGLGGAIVSSHGIGTVYPQFLPPFQSESQSGVAVAIQRQLDPGGILLGRKLVPINGRCLSRNWSERVHGEVDERDA